MLFNIPESTYIVWLGCFIIVACALILVAAVRLWESRADRRESRKAWDWLRSPEAWADATVSDRVGRLHRMLANIVDLKDTPEMHVEYTRMFFELQEANDRIADLESQLAETEEDLFVWAATAEKKDLLRNRYLQKVRKYKTVVEEAEAILADIVDPISELEETVPSAWIEYTETDTLALELHDILVKV